MDVGVLGGGIAKVGGRWRGPSGRGGRGAVAASGRVGVRGDAGRGGRQQLSRNLAFGTVDARLDLLRRFHDHFGGFPWQWTPQHLEEWSTDLRAVRGLALSTVRAYQLAIRSFLGYVCEPLYGWDVECEKRFGTHPIQISHDWNSAKHILDVEGRPQRRALTRQELQLLFDAADEMVEEIRRNGRKGAVAAFRDAAMLKTAYAFGLRRRELVRLEVHDFGRNPKATEFGDFGVCYVRFGKGSQGSGPKRRSVLTVMPWSVDILTEWVHDIWPYCRRENSAALWPSERSQRMSETRFNAAFVKLRERVGLPAELGPHCLRHSYITHLIEDGFDPLFVQQQVGHLRIAEEDVPMPEPLDSLITDLITQRRNMGTAANPTPAGSRPSTNCSWPRPYVLGPVTGRFDDIQNSVSRTRSGRYPVGPSWASSASMSTLADDTPSDRSFSLVRQSRTCPRHRFARRVTGRRAG
ncbi:site-specific integrase [Nocardia sp. NBC_00881]|nr:site-specific integrase [Nocardia sp. NBC_00881]